MIVHIFTKTSIQPNLRRNHKAKLSKHFGESNFGF